MKRGYTRHAKRWPVSKQLPLLEAAGCNMKAVYKDDDWAKAIKSLLPGDKLVVGGGLRVIGDNRKEIVAALDEVRAKGATVMDAETKREAGGDDGATLLDEALRKIQGGATIASSEVAAAMQKKSAKARTKGRIPEREALAIWRDPSLTVVEKVALCKGWSKRTLYNHFNGTGVGTGRRPNALKK